MVRREGIEPPLTFVSAYEAGAYTILPPAHFIYYTNILSECQPIKLL